MAYQNEKVKARQTVAQSNTQSKDLGIVSEVPMGDWNATTQYQKLNKVRYVSTGGSGVTLLAKRQNQGVEPFISQGWQDVWMVENYDGGSVSPDGNYQGMIVGNATNAQNDGNGENIVEQFTAINEKIPSTASAENQLADKAFVNSSINNLAAFYITYNSSGDAFPTRAALLNATTFYNAGQPRTPTQNDYAYVLADESQPKDSLGNYPTTRYSYQGGAYPNGQWGFQYVVNNTSLTQAQVDAINSGITAELVEQISEGDVSPTGTYPGMTVGNANNAENAASAEQATRLTTPRTISGVFFNGSSNIDNYANCTSGASTTAKTATKTGFISTAQELVAGVRITVKFSNANTANSPTLNVNSTGAKRIKADDDISYVKWKAGAIMTFEYDGTYWVCVGGYQLAGKRVNCIYASDTNTSPATLYGGSWEPLGDYPTSKVIRLKANADYSSYSPNTQVLLAQITIPANCVACINGYVQANASDSAAIMSAKLQCDSPAIDLNTRTTLNSGGGCMTSTTMDSQANSYMVKLMTYNYRSVATQFAGFIEALCFPVEYAWKRTA